ncbi:MAG: hypothetical protein IPO07_29670 [Haliscomenobacter sp.]|nr:hypothetical protein [Haliscomenobacter sp.]
MDSENKLTITLKDQTKVTLYGQAATLSDEKSKNYYYLPCALRLSKKRDGTPEFLFMKFTSDEKSATGVTQGALLHLLMEYGLSKEQEVELAGVLKSRYNGALLKGAADVEPDGDNSVRIISSNKTGVKWTVWCRRTPPFLKKPTIKIMAKKWPIL